MQLQNIVMELTGLGRDIYKTIQGDNTGNGTSHLKPSTRT